MEKIVFNQGEPISWINNADQVINWTNNASNIIYFLGLNVDYSIRLADFVRVTTSTATYRFSTAPAAMTIPAVDSQPFDGLGVLVSIGDVQRDIKSTANETQLTLVGIDTSLLGWVLGHDIKGSKIEMWHGFFNNDNQLITEGGTGGLYKFFTGYISNFSISEKWLEEVRSFVGTIGINASSIQIILQNKVAGRYTNDNAWKFWNPGDTSMARVGFIETINYAFGATGVPTVTNAIAITKSTTTPIEV